MKQKDFIFNICLLLFLNLLVKPFWLLGVEVGVQNQVGAADYGLYFAVFNFTYVFYMLLDMGICNYNNRTIARNNLLLVKLLSRIIESRNKEASVHIKHVSTITWELLKTWQNLYPEDAFSEDDMKLSLNFTTVIY